MGNIPCRRICFLLAMIVVLIPLFFINVRDSHDWGGDFAMYIMQARNIVDGISQSETPYIYNPANPVLGPPAYPIGFPLLLSPVYALAGNSILAFSLLIAAFLFATGMMMAIYLRRYFPGIVVFFLVVIMVYNPWTLNMKLEIMSEFAFTFFLLLGVWLFEKYEFNRSMPALLVALTAGFLISIRAIGMVFPVAVIVTFVFNYRWFRIRMGMRKAVNFIIIAAGSIFVYYILNRVLFVVPQAQGGSYAGIWGNEAINVTILSNLAYYVEQLKYFFAPWGGTWNFLPLALKAVIFTFILLGMIISYARKPRFMEMLVIAYLAVLMIYPYRGAGIRFLFPIMPFLLVFLARGLETVSIFPGITKTTKTWALGLLVMASYLNMYYFIWKDQGKMIPGPQEKASQEAFAFIRENTAKDAVILFSKPRVLALYTGRPGLANSKEESIAEIGTLIKEYNVSYVLIHSEISDPAIQQWYAGEGEMSELAWKNDKFTLLKINDR